MNDKFKKVLKDQVKIKDTGLLSELTSDSWQVENVFVFSGKK